MSSGFDAVGFGALNVDKLFKVDRIAGRDEESFVVGYCESSGGSAANTIVGLARLGLTTGFVGKVAADHEGRRLLDDFKKEHVDVEGIVTVDRGRSGVVMGFVDRKGERALYVAPGVNDTIELAEVSLEYVANARLLHLTSFVGEKSFETQMELVELLPSRVKVSFDPGALYAGKGLSVLKHVVDRTFVMLPNESELKRLTGEDYEKGAKTLLARGVKIVAVKLGTKGCFLTNGEEAYTIKPCEAEVVDTTGAGDAWNAGFLYGLLNNKGLEKCGMLGNFVASHCIKKMGARNGLPYAADLIRCKV